jgi:cellulose synthase/poly-beta-1,6-N-acetylglucosamine synthase-like glycosyltransferase
MSDCFVPRVTVVIPTYRRPEHLERCLAGLIKQSVAPAETIVVHRVGDDATTAVMRECPHTVGEVVVTEPGVLTAMEAGVAAASSDIVAFIDEDAVPRADWLERLGRHFQDPEVGGVGGRDVIVTTMSEAMTADVGRLTSWGKPIGNHHRGPAGHAMSWC